MMRKLFLIQTALLIVCVPSMQAGKTPSKALVFFYRVGEWMDNFQLKDLDTNYIALPEHSWHVALTAGGVGIHSTYTTWVDPETAVTLRAQTTPSLDIGFSADYRGLGGGYSWDVLNAYTTKWNISLGGSALGMEIARNVSTNLKGKFYMGKEWMANTPVLDKGEFRISTTSLSAWYILNATHYSHNAAFDHCTIQKRTAGSLLLSLAYMSSQMEILDTAKYIHDENAVTLIDGVTGTITRQVALGLGYGINYTPNRGKVLLHASANMQLVCYSVNHISYALPSTGSLQGEPQFVMRPATPVHVTGNIRAAVSWEISPWVYLSAWGQAYHLRFKSKSGDMSALAIGNWNWQAHINIGVRFGAGQKRVREVLGEPKRPVTSPKPEKKSRMPQWLTDYFFAPAH